MPDEQLRLVASVTDGFTSPLRKLKAELGSIKVPPAVGQMTSALGAWRTQIDSSVSSIRSLGIASFGLGIGLGGVTAAVTNFAGRTQSLRLMSRELGLSMERLRALGSAGERFGVSAETMNNGLRGFASAMVQVKERYGEAYGVLKDMNLSSLAESLANAPNMSAAIDRLFAGLANIPDAQKRRRVLQALGLPEDWSQIAGEVGSRFKLVVDEIEKNQGRIGKATADASDAFQRNIATMNESLESLKVQGLTPVLEVANQLFDKLNTPDALAGLKHTIDDATKGLRDIVSGLDHLQRGEYGQAARDIVGGDGAMARKVAPRAGDDVIAAQEKVDDLKRRIGRADNLKGGALDSMGLIDNSVGDRLREELKGAEAELKKAQDADARRRLGEALRLSRRRDAAESERDEVRKDPDSDRKRDREAELTREIEKLTAELKKLTGSGIGGFQKTGFGGPGGFGIGGLIQNANFSTGVGFGGGGGFGGVTGGARGGIEGGAPAGDGRGTRGGAATGDMMAWAMDQLRREGVPEANLRAAAAHLVGQAQVESGLNPNASHDIDPRTGKPTGFGIYGARDPGGRGRQRRTEMLRWLKANGYAPNSAEGQMRYMAREAMSKFYPRTRRTLLQATPDTLGPDSFGITRDFESPRVINDRSGAVARAYRTGPSANMPSPTAPSGSRNLFGKDERDRDGVFFERNRPDSYPDLWMQGGSQAATARSSDGTPMEGRGQGDSMMGRAFGPGGVAAPPPKVDANGSVTVVLGPGMEKHTASVKTDGLFSEASIVRGGSQLS